MPHFFLTSIQPPTQHTRQIHRSNNMSTSTSHPLLNFNNNNNNGNSRSLFSSSRGQTYDKSTQTPESIERETRRQKFRSLKTFKINNVPTPSLNFKISFLNNRKRTNLSANAVATEQKATKVSKMDWLTLFVSCAIKNVAID